MINYLLESTISLAVFIVIYLLLLRKEKLLVFKRYYLIVTAIISLVIPLFEVEVFTQPQEESIHRNEILQENAVTFISDNIIVPIQQPINETIFDTERKFNPLLILELFYFAGLLFFLIRFARNLYLLFRKAVILPYTSFQGIRLILEPGKTAPYCFFRYIYVNRKDFEDGAIRESILHHEIAHLKQFHTIDLILIELIHAVYWFNPLMLLYKSAIKINHEYLADSAAINKSVTIKDYYESLIRFTIRNTTTALACGFNYSQIKKRLKMASKTTSLTVAMSKVLLVVPLVLLLVVNIAATRVNIQNPEPADNLKGIEIIGNTERIQTESADLLTEMESATEIPEQEADRLIPEDHAANVFYADSMTILQEPDYDTLPDLDNNSSQNSLLRINDDGILMAEAASIRVVSIQKKRDKYGLVSSDGRFILKAEYDNIQLYGNLFKITKDRHYGLANLEGRIILEPIYDLIQLSGGFIKVMKDNKYGLLSMNGSVIVNPICDLIQMNGGFIKIMINNKYGIVSMNGAVILEPEYDLIQLTGGAVKVMKGNKYGLLSMNGSVIVNPICDLIQMNGGFIKIMINNKYGIVSMNGAVILEPKYDLIQLTGGVIKVMKDNKYGVVSMNGSAIVKPDYDLVLINGSYIKVMRDNKYGIISMNGSLILEPKYDDIKFQGNYFIVRKGLKETIVDFSGREI